MTKLIYHGHSCVEIRHNEHIIFIDPYIEGNAYIPPNKLSDLKTNDVKCDYIILSHGHADHYGSTEEIAKKNNATVIAMVEIADSLSNKGLKAHAMNLGGAFQFPFGKVKLTLAHHSSSLPDGSYGGDPAGIIISLGEKNIYHAGDTALFYDMKLIGEMCRIDYAFLPIGDNFTMGIDDAVKAAEFLNAETVIPIHYNTFDEIKADPNEFKRKIESIGKKCSAIKPGEFIDV